MTSTQQGDEALRHLKEVVNRWAPASNEEFEVRMMRALLHLYAYEKEVERVMRGERPIRTDYPIPLPTKH